MNRIDLGVVINGFVCFFFLSILAFPRGYNYAPFFLCLLAFGYVTYTLWKKNTVAFNCEEKQLLWVYVFYFFTFLLSFLVHDDKASLLDKPSKILLFLLLLPLFFRFQLRLAWVFHGISVGAFIAGIVALYHRFILHKEQAFFTHMHIQGGDIAMSIAMFSLIVTIYFAIKKQYKLTALYLFFTIMGILAGFLSTARGAWIGLPFILCFILFVYRKYVSKVFLGGLFAVILASISLATFIPNTQIIHRFNQATNEISGYIYQDNGSTSVGARFDMWKSAWLQIKAKPVLGWGEQGAKENREEQGKLGIISDYASQFGHVHNQFLDDFSKRGIIGFIAFLLVLGVPFWLYFKRLSHTTLEQTTIAVLGCVHIISVAFYCLSQSFFSHNSGSVFYFFLVIVFYAMFKTADDLNESS